MCRCLAGDLPVNPVLASLNTFAYGAKRLLNVSMPEDFITNKVDNLNRCFTGCSNLLSCTGFSYLKGENVSCFGLFDGCSSLTTTDFKFPSLVKLGNNRRIFADCVKLNDNISSYFEDMNFAVGTINVEKMFYNCKALSGTVPGDKLWERQDIKWTNTSDCFTGCLSGIRSQVPTSWGGINTSKQSLIDVSWYGEDYDKLDYTAFEVYANDEAIPVGESTKLNGTISYEIPSGMTEKFKIRTSNIQYDAVDVVVDWGDGSVIPLKDMSGDSKTTITKNKDFGADFTLSHTYSNSGKYIIRIFGTTYYGINFVSSETNLICRIFDHDLPIYSKINNISSMVNGALRLLKLAIPRYSMMLKNVINATNTFANCYNLRSATGFEKMLDNLYTCNAFFASCKSLRTTDFVLPSNVTDVNGIAMTFYGCNRLSSDINALLPVNGFTNKKLNIQNLFYDCFDLTGTVPASKLWEETNIEWLNVDKAFGKTVDSGEIYNLRSQVPTSWGGINTEIEAKLQAGYWNNVQIHDLNDYAKFTDEEYETIKSALSSINEMI